ncbi:AMP-binding protein [Sinomonas sp. JGH33]|uniref:AMP-binding protein n=1 Tax=Sinomonas terricola TaxID=3110330 RepID=A0ABU5T694_9MICC|nr:AMP-binding protein [Sinomonas sp. JGH33]MEA5455191.1 AMP-binding protein [Sinomonas sp. JGH33]
MKSVIDWMDNPQPNRGIRFAERGDEWTYRSYASLAEEARRIATVQREHGVRPGDVVSLVISEPRRFVPWFLGTLAAGAVASPIASPLTSASDRYAEHIAQITKVARPRALFSDAELLDLGREGLRLAGSGAEIAAAGDPGGAAPGEIARVDSDSLQLLQFTSGSSGTPKGVRVSQANLAANVTSILSWLGVGPDDSTASWLPTYHDMGLVGTFLGSVTAQIDLWMMTPTDFLRSPLRWVELFGRRGATTTASPNFGYSLVNRKVRPEQLDGMDFSSWRVAMSGAERVDPSVTATFTRLLEPFGFRPTAFTPCYGMAEATLAVSGITPGSPCRMVRHDGELVPGEPVRIIEEAVLGTRVPDTSGWLASCGRPMPGASVDVVDESGTTVPEGHFGELRVAGPGVAQGYSALEPGASSGFTDAGLRTGDAGFMLDGEVYVVGRRGESLKVRGRVVHAEDVEQLLWEVEGIAAGHVAVALAATPDGNEAIVVVESDGGTWLGEATAVVRSATDAELALTVVRVNRGVIPRTSSGKPRRRALIRACRNGELAGEVLLASRGHGLPARRAVAAQASAH